MKKIVAILPVVITLACFAAAFYVYPLLPERVASHWNAAGEVNGYMSKFWGAFLMPIMAFGMLGLFWLVPKIDPRRRNIQEFFGTFQLFIACVFLFFAYIYALTLWWNLGGRFNLTVFMVPALAALFYMMGELVAKARPNWFIGIRTPWTLENETVWSKTHALGGRLYKFCALVTLLSLLVPQVAIWVLLISIIGVSLFLVMYSYLEFQRQENSRS
ncbi:MAG: DUF1648 domain-containing protein [Patescibacteria group bacterium]|nr:DUF1648 domain-containing protein [Patescibacteria group bacterium]